MNRETAERYDWMEKLYKETSGSVFEEPRKWIRTRQDVLLKYFPRVEIDVTDGIVIISPCVVDNEYECIGECDKCRKNYWLAEVGYYD